MKSFVAVMTWDNDGRVSKFLDFDTSADAEAHVAAFIGRWPDAFVADTPVGGSRDWVVAGKALIHQPAPPPPPTPVPPALEDVYVALRDKLQGKPGSDAALAAIDAKFDGVKPSALRGPQ